MNNQDGALYVGMETDNKQFIGAMNEAERRVKGFSDASVTAGEKVNETFTAITAQSVKMTNSFKTESKREIGLIADMERALVELKEKKRAAFTVEEIQKYNKKIQEAELNLREYNEAGKQVVDTSKSQVEVNESLSGSVSKWALGLGGAAAALAVLKKAFQETVGGMNLFNNVGAITSQILNDIVSGAGLSITRMQSALAIQKELNALRVKEYVDGFKASQYNNQYQQLYSKSLDQTLERAERLKLIDEALAAHNKAIDIEVENVNENLRLTKAGILDKPGNEKLIKEYASLMTQLENLDAQRVSSTKRLTTTRSSLIKEGIDEEKKWREDLHNNLQRLADEEIQINKDNAKKLRDLNNEIAASKLKDQDKELLQLKQRYDIDIETYANNEKMKVALAEKYALDRYEIELKYLKKLQDENEKFAEKLGKIDPGKGYSILNRALLSSGNKPASGSESIEGANMGHEAAALTSAAWAKAMQKAIEENDKKQIESLNEQLELRNEIISAASDLTYEIGKQLGLGEEELKVLNDKLNVIGQFASGNLVGAVTTTAMSIISGFMALIPDNAAKFAAQVEHLNRLLEIQQRLIEQSARIGGGGDAREDNIAILEAKKAAQQAALKKAQKTLSGGDFWNTGAKMKKAAEDVAELTKAIEDIDYEILQAGQDLDSFLLGGLTEETIASSIRQGFEEGKNSAADFADTFNDLMSTAINSALEELSKPAWSAWYKNLAEFMASGGGIDDEERAKLKADWDKNIADDKARREEAYKIAGIDPAGSSADKSLSGSIRGVSEETASVVAGQMNAMRITQALGVDLLRQQLMHLAEISYNTRYLISIDSKLNNNSLRPQGLS